MNKNIPRLRMFAGPNGSGKTTIKAILNPELLGYYINPDDLEKEIREHDFLNFDHYGLQVSADEVLPFFTQSPLLKKVDQIDEAHELKFFENRLSFFNAPINAYFASVAADFLRQKLLDLRKTFTFETVMSSPDKVEFLRTARERGYRTYLYFVATSDPQLNIERVQARVQMGGHPVPKDKIIARYKRSLDLLMDAISWSNRAYILDNSGSEHILIAEITDGKTLETKTDMIPEWFKKAVWEKIEGSKR